MRTIKFRGKRCDNGEWVYGYYARLRNEFKEWHCIMTEKDALALVQLDEDLLEDAKNKQIQRFRQKIVELQKQFDEL